MPIPSSSVGEAIKFLNKEKPNMKQKQVIAVALNVVRKGKK